MTMSSFNPSVIRARDGSMTAKIVSRLHQS